MQVNGVNIGDLLKITGVSEVNIEGYLVRLFSRVYLS